MMRTSGSSARHAWMAGSPTKVPPETASPKPPATGPVTSASAQEQLLFWLPACASSGVTYWPSTT